MKKLGIWIGLPLVVAVVCAVVYVGRVARLAVEAGVETATGVETDVGFVYLGLFSGVFRMRGLEIHNPAGFEADHFIRVGDTRTSVSYRALRQGRVVIPELLISDIDVRLESKGGRQNYSVILDHMGAGPPASGPDAGSQIEFIIQKLVIRDIKARVRLLPALGEITEVSVEIPELSLENVGGDSPDGLALADLGRIVITAVLTSVAQKSADLPGQVVGGLRAGLRRLPALPSALRGPIDEGVNALVERAGAAVENGSDALSEGGGRLLEGLGRIGRDRD